MKKNEKEIANVVVEPVMDEDSKVQYIKENIGAVPKMFMKRFQLLSTDKQVEAIQHYLENARLRAEFIENNRLVNRTKRLFDQRHGTVQDAQEIMRFCQEFIDSAKEREIEKLNEQIAKLEAMKKALED